VTSFPVSVMGAYAQPPNWEKLGKALERWSADDPAHGLMVEESLRPNYFPNTRYTITAKDEVEAIAMAERLFSEEMISISTGEPDSIHVDVGANAQTARDWRPPGQT